MTQKITMGDLLAPETKRDPAAFFAHLRAQEPLVAIENFFDRGRAWIITDYDDATKLFRDPRFTKNMRKIAGTGEGNVLPDDTPDNPFIGLTQNMLNFDPPDHTRLRGLVWKGFTRRMIELLRPRIQQITVLLLDDVLERGEIDIMSDFAYPLPITVISEMLGIPAADRPQFRHWTQIIVNSGENSFQEAEIVAAMSEFLHYVKALLAEKRAHPGNDLLGTLVQVEENGDKLSESELIAMTFLLIVAGHETTVNLIGNGTLALLQHPDQMRQLQNDPSLILSAVEELLRFAGPIGLSDQRWALEDISMYGEVFHKGEMVYAALGGVNTDPHQFHDPETLDITRQENQHLAFGKGIHYCLGAPLARLEGQIAFDTLLRRLPNLRLATDPEQLTWTNNFTLRGLRSLPVTF